MTQPRRPDEISLFAELRDVARKHDTSYGRQPGLLNVERIGRELGIPERRLQYILWKWSGKGWWNWGVCVEGGWFEDGAPETLAP